MTKEEFIESIAEYVKKYAPKYGITVYSPIIAQACLESSYGTSSKAKYHNYFGLKYRKGRCPTACGTFEDGSSEQRPDSIYIGVVDQWFAFSYMEAGVQGYFDFINISNYQNLKGITDPRKYLETLRADKYCTSLNYVDNVMAVIDKWDLTKWDKEEPVTSKKALYKVQVGAFGVKANAEKLAKELKSKGYQTMVVEVKS